MLWSCLAKLPRPKYFVTQKKQRKVFGKATVTLNLHVAGRQWSRDNNVLDVEIGMSHYLHCHSQIHCRVFILINFYMDPPTINYSNIFYLLTWLFHVRPTRHPHFLLPSPPGGDGWHNKSLPFFFFFFFPICQSIGGENFLSHIISIMI